MLLISTYVAQSPIEGLGVFAGEYVPRGSLIWKLNPKFDIFVHETEIGTLPAHMKGFIARYTYPHLEMQGYRVLDADNGRFMNHSLAPNTDFRIFDTGYALVDIAEGEEITCNYHEFDPGFVGFLPGMAATTLDAQLHANGR
ncbi:MAG: SET domain-containing protein [Methyloceanibacter sp.]|uniref:SET domain-containing protein n=1 Tax=Methyloceanibacter sp. TaxID=1965321 RepID=UPI003D6D659C